MKKKRLQAENKKRIKVQSIASRKCLWAFRMFIIAVFMSLFFGFLSHDYLKNNTHTCIATIANDDKDFFGEYAAD